MWGGIACAVALLVKLVTRSGGVERLGRAHRALRLCTLGWAAVDSVVDGCRAALDLKLILNLLPIFRKTVEHFAVSATRWF